MNIASTHPMQLQQRSDLPTYSVLAHTPVPLQLILPIRICKIMVVPNTSLLLECLHFYYMLKV